MERVIKFRAWDKQQNCWYTPIHEAYKGNLFELLIGFSGDLSAHTMNGMIHESMWLYRFELMQFTGLHDKNGKEIYEGDIMQHANPFDIPFVVNWSNEECAFVFNDGSTGYLINDTSFEIIGNLYENPELLNQ